MRIPFKSFLANLSYQISHGFTFSTDPSKIEQLSMSDSQLHKKICEIFDVDVEFKDFVVEEVVRRTERLNLLKQYTDDKKILEQVDLVAFNQEELDELIKEGQSLIYLCANRFTIPLNEGNKMYIGINKKKIIAVIQSSSVVDFDKLNIEFQNVEFDDDYNAVLKKNELSEQKKIAAEQESEHEKIRLAKKWLDEGYKALRKKEYQTAFRYFSKAAEAGNNLSMFNLGLMYYKGEGVDKDLTQAFAWFKKSAETGYINAMINVSMMYEDGKGVDRDLTQAFLWCKKAAETGDIKSMANVGRMYDKGIGVDEDQTKAFYWYKKSAEAGDSNGMFLVAYMYREGEGVNKDLTQAFLWFKRSAEAGNIVAMRNLAKCYRNGEGVTIDIEQAEYWERKSREF